MIAIDFDYTRPTQLGDALKLLSQEGAIPLAGGQSLVPALSTASALTAVKKPSLLVDISRLTELQGLAIENDHLIIGAAVTMAAVASARATRAVPLLGEVLRTVASAAVRNRGTLVGNLVAASPNSELPVVMVALDAVLTLRSTKGTRVLAAADFFVAPHQTVLSAGEIVTEVRLPVPLARTAGSFREVAARSGAPPLCCVAACLAAGPDSRLCDVRIAVGGIAGRPIRIADSETSLVGVPVAGGIPSDFSKVVHVAPSPEQPESEYSATVLPVLIRRAVTDAIAHLRAGAPSA